MTKIVLIEDEPQAQERVLDLLKSISPKLQVIKILDSVTESITYLSDAPHYDLILLDIHLADGKSFEIFNHVTITKPIIFTTAFDQYAMDAFKLYAVDYLLKPIKKDLLDLAIKKYDQLFRPQISDYRLLASESSTDKKWIIKIGTQIRVVDHEEVAYYYTSDKISYLMTMSNKKYTINYSLEQIETMISGKNYFRINRQFIIAQKAILKMFTFTKSRVKIILAPIETEVVVSTERSSAFKKWIAQ